VCVCKRHAAVRRQKLHRIFSGYLLRGEQHATGEFQRQQAH